MNTVCWGKEPQNPGPYMSNQIDYARLMHDAMRGLVANLLRDVMDNGLPGEHHFFVTYDTREKGVVMPDWLRERYPEEITIVIQHEFKDLGVQDAGFRIVLEFGGTPVALYVPFSAVRTFVDPSVEFGLRFDHSENDEADTEEEAVDEAPMAKDVSDDAPHKDAQVVRLDQFRK